MRSIGASAVWLVLRAGLRRVWRSALVLALLFGLTAGLAAAALVTAGRIESAYDDLLRDVDAPDLATGCFSCESVEEAEQFLDTLRADPAVSVVARLEEILPVLRTADGRLLGPASEECAQGDANLSIISADWPPSTGPPMRIVDGRFARTASEIALPLTTARRSAVGVGDEVVLEENCFHEGRLEQPLRLTVVGVFVGFLDVRPVGQSVAFENPAVTADFAEVNGLFAESGVVVVWLEPDHVVADIDPANAESIFFDVALHAEDIRSHLRPDATALRLFAALMALAAIAVLGQLLARHVRSTATDHAALHSLGARPADLAVLGVAHGAVVGIGAGATAAVATVVIVPLIPAGAAEYSLRGTGPPSPWLAALATASAIALVVTALAVVPALLVARAKPRTIPLRPTWAGRFAGSARLSPTRSWGVRVALEPGTAAHNVPVRSGLGAAVLAAAAVAGVVTFGAGLDHLRATPRLVGWNWDVVVDNDQNPPPSGVDEVLAAHPDVERWSWGRSGQGFSVGPGLNDELAYLSFSTGPRAVRPVAVAGRAPEGPDEILLESDMVEYLDVEIGETVDVIVEDWLGRAADELGVPTERGDVRIVPYELVGTGVVPVATFQRGGAALTLDGVRRAYAAPTRAEATTVMVAADFERLVEWLGFEHPELAIELQAAGPDGADAVIAGWTDEEFDGLYPTVNAYQLFVDLVDGTSPKRLLSDLRDIGLVSEGTVLEGVVDGRLATSTEVVTLDLEDVDWLPTGLGVVMAITVAAVLAHLVATGARARRGDLATLKALGFSRGQVRSVVMWQAVALALLSGLIAIPIGGVVGRFAWHRYAEGLGVVPEAVTPWWGAVLLLAALVVVAVLAAVVPALAAGRRRPSDSLRSE